MQNNYLVDGEVNEMAHWALERFENGNGKQTTERMHDLVWIAVENSQSLRNTNHQQEPREEIEDLVIERVNELVDPGQYNTDHTFGMRA